MNILTSFAYAAGVEPLIESWRGKVLIDSGAFSAHTRGKKIDIGQYVEFCSKYSCRVSGYIQLDVIGDKRKTERNLDIMIKAGLRPLPVVTTDDEPERVRSMLDVNPWVCVAGGPFLPTGTFLKRARRIADIAQSHRSDAKLHGLGFTRAARAIVMSGLSTVDSASWKVGPDRYGFRAYYSPISGSVKFMKPGAKMVRDEQRRMLVDGPPIRLHGKRPISGRCSWQLYLSVLAHLRMYEYLRRNGVTMFFAVNSRDEAFMVASCAVCLSDGWRIDWERIHSALAKLKSISIKDAAQVIELATSNVHSQTVA